MPAVRDGIRVKVRCRTPYDCVHLLCMQTHTHAHMHRAGRSTCIQSKYCIIICVLRDNESGGHWGGKVTWRGAGLYPQDHSATPDPLSLALTPLLLSLLIHLLPSISVRCPRPQMHHKHKANVFCCYSCCFVNAALVSLSVHVWKCNSSPGGGMPRQISGTSEVLLISEIC